ncbi:MAG: DUF309 domain-containing protein [Nitrospiraceae bacterium]
MNEPQTPDPSWPRYSTRPFPPYRFVPGQTPHPRRDPHGHSYGQPEPKPLPFPPAEWHKSEDYLYGIDLYNFAYWWESHEVFEGLWHAVGHKTQQGQFFQALIQLAAANLKRHLGNATATNNLARSGLTRLQKIPPIYMGVDVVALAEDVKKYFLASRVQQAMIRLDLPLTGSASSVRQG